MLGPNFVGGHLAAREYAVHGLVQDVSGFGEQVIRSPFPYDVLLMVTELDAVDVPDYAILVHDEDELRKTREDTSEKFPIH
jgi:hypothetical protein